MKTKIFNSAMEECPRFFFCNLNCCPLANKNYKNDPSDPAIISKQKCIPKSIRLRIGLTWELINKGMKPRELTAMRKWEELSEFEKQKRIQNLKQNSSLTRCLERGLKVSIKPKGYLPEPFITSQKQATARPQGEGEVQK